MIPSVEYAVLKTAVLLVQNLPLKAAARLGRFLGFAAYCADIRRRRRAVHNLRCVFGREWERRKIAAVAKENFQRLGESYCCAVKSVRMSGEQLKLHVHCVGSEQLRQANRRAKNQIVAIGHFGNFELYARLGQLIGLSNTAATYRALKNSAANRIMETLRRQSGTRFFERRREAEALKKSLQRGGMVLGLLADHHAGGGAEAEFLGLTCLATKAPAVLALRYRADLRTAICYRTGLAQWRIEIGKAIPLYNGNQARPVGDIIQNVQNALTEAVRRDPANWFWVHRRWRKTAPSSPRKTKACEHSPVGAGNLPPNSSNLPPCG